MNGALPKPERHRLFRAAAWKLGNWAGRQAKPRPHRNIVSEGRGRTPAISICMAENLLAPPWRSMRASDISLRLVRVAHGRFLPLGPPQLAASLFFVCL